MTQPIEKEHDQWIDALSGNPDPNADASINTQALALRKALGDRSRKIDAQVPDADEVLFQKIKSRIQKDEKAKSSAPTWKAIITYVLAAFAFGVITTRMALIPTMQASRSTNADIEVIDGHAVQTVTVRVSDPIKVVQAAMAEAVELGLTVRIDQTANGYRLYIDGLTSYSPKQEKLRGILGISDSASGKAIFLIQVTEAKN